MEEIIVGVVGVLQFDVLKYRLENEYNVDIRLENLPYEYIRWIDNPQDFDLAKLSGTSDMKKVKDLKDRPLLLFVNEDVYKRQPYLAGYVADRYDVNMEECMGRATNRIRQSAEDEMCIRDRICTGSIYFDKNRVYNFSLLYGRIRDCTDS